MHWDFQVFDIIFFQVWKPYLYFSVLQQNLSILDTHNNQMHGRVPTPHQLRPILGHYWWMPLCTCKSMAKFKHYNIAVQWDVLPTCSPSLQITCIIECCYKLWIIGNTHPWHVIPTCQNSWRMQRNAEIKVLRLFKT